MTAVRRVALASVVGALLAASAMTAHSSPTSAGTGARTVAASAASGGQVKITGWATFSGVNIAAGKDPAGDAGPTADQTGSDLIGAQLVYRPELADLYIRWQVKKLPSTSLGAVNRVGFPTTIYVLRTEIAKVPVEIRVQSQGVTQLFELYTSQTEAGYTRVASLTGAFGTTGEEVIVTIPLATLAANKLPLNEGNQIGTPRAFIASSPSIATPTMDPLAGDFISMGKTAKVTVPVKSVTVSAGKYTAKAALNKGYFTGYLPRKAFPRNPGTVTTKTCLGTVCVKQTFTVRV